MTASRRVSALAATLALAVPLVVAACSSSPKLSMPGAPEDPDSIIAESVVILPGEPRAPVQSVALTRHYDRGLSSTVYELVRLDGENQEPVWRTPPLGDKTYRVPLTTDGTRVLTAIEDRVYAFDLANGRPLWDAPLTDVFRAGCHNCFDVVGSRLIVRSYDSVIHAIDTTDGTVDWSHRLVSTSGGTRVVGTHLLLFDDGDDGEPRASVIDPATGEVLVPIDATCSYADRPTFARPISATAQALPSTTEPNAAYLGYGLIPACWQKWDLATGTQVWDTVLPDDYLDHGTVAVLDEPVLTVRTRNPSLVQLDTLTGAGAAIALPPDLDLTPIANVGGRVIAQAVSTRGTETWSIVAVDPASGDVAWSVPLDDAEPVDEVGTWTVSANETVFAADVDGDQLRLVFLDGGDGLLTQRISLVDGTTAGRSPVAFHANSMFSSFWPLQWRGATAVVVAYDRLVVIDTNTSTVTWSS